MAGISMLVFFFLKDHGTKTGKLTKGLLGDYSNTWSPRVEQRTGSEASLTYPPNYIQHRPPPDIPGIDGSSFDSQRIRTRVSRHHGDLFILDQGSPIACKQPSHGKRNCRCAAARCSTSDSIVNDFHPDRMGGPLRRRYQWHRSRNRQDQRPGCQKPEKGAGTHTDSGKGYRKWECVRFSQQQELEIQCSWQQSWVSNWWSGQWQQ